MFISLLKKRRSIRKYKDKTVEAEKIDILIEAALRSPSSMGRNPWEFIIVKDAEMMERLSKSKPHGASFLKKAPCAIVVCGDPQKCDVWIEDCSIASVFIHVAAESIGLGSCWIQIRERMYSEIKSSSDYISELLNIPTSLEVESIIAVGYPDEEKSGHNKEKLPFDKIHRGVYGDK
jgi:nitroreductase